MDNTVLKLAFFAVLILVFASSATASVDSTTFQELPSAWETSENLDFQVSAQGSNINQIILQSREPGEPGFTDRRTKTCSDSSNCEWNLQHSEPYEREYEYRFRAYSDSENENSRYQTVEYFSDLNYNVDWSSKPPNSASSGDTVSMSVTASDSAGRFDEEGILRIQYRNDDENWITFDSRNCWDSGNQNTCSNSGETRINEDKVQYGEASFRGKIVFEGGITATSSVETVSTSEDDSDNVDSADLNDLPNEVAEGSSFSIEAEASGTNLDEIIIQQKNPADSGWTDWRTYNCGGNDECSFSRSYSVETTGSKQFRARAWTNNGDTENSDTQTVDFVDDTERGNIDEVNLDNLPDTYSTETDLEIAGDAEGENLDSLKLQKREVDGDWQQVNSQNCNNNDECSFSYDYSQSSEEETDFRLKAEAGENQQNSNSQTVEFVDAVPSQSVDSVTINDLPDTQPADESLNIEGSAEGENLDEIRIQKRIPGSSNWENITTNSCSGDSCSLSASFTASNEDAWDGEEADDDGNWDGEEADDDDGEEGVEFRVRATAGDDTANSNTEIVEFIPDAEETVDSVSIDSLPSTHPVGADLTISGSAEGQNLDNIIIQHKNSEMSSWNDYRSKDCGNSNSCTISRSFSEDEGREKDFRIRAVAGDDADNSSIKTVTFEEEEVTSVDSVTLNNLPNHYPVRTDLEITGSSEGTNLDQLKIEKRNEGSIGWNKIGSTSCGGSSSCEISVNYVSRNTIPIGFRIKGAAGGEQENSDIEVVEFTPLPPEDLIDSVDIEAPGEAQTGESVEINASASGENLGNLEIQLRVGGTWVTQENFNCGSGTECSTSFMYSSSSSGVKDFRAKISAEDQQETSSIDSMTILEPPEEPSIDTVDINNLPDSKAVNTDLRVSGSAEGFELQNISIDVRDNTSTPWNTLETSDCGGSSSCEVEGDYSSGEIDTKYFRVTASTAEETSSSNTEVVDFFEPVVEVEPRVSSVVLGDLPIRYSTNEILEVTAEATGAELDNLILQRRIEGSIGWRNLREVDCESMASCSIEDYEFERGNPSAVTFRAKARADNDVMYSSMRTVEFIRSGGNGGDDGDPDGESELRVIVEDEDDSQLEDARVRVRNGETFVERTDDDGEADFELESDQYNVRVSKSDYATEDRDITLDDEDDRTVRFYLEEDEDSDGVQITALDHPEDICEGDNLRVNAVIENRQSTDATVVVSGSGLGDTNTQLLDIDDESIAETEVVFENVEGTGSRQFTINADIEGSGDSSRTRTVEVNSCQAEDEEPVSTPAGLTANLDPREILVGETVRVYGEVLRTQTSQEVSITAEDVDREVFSSRSGKYQAFISPQTTGEVQVRIRSAGFERTRQLEVLPRAQVSSIDSPRTVFEGDRFQVCGQVNSQVEADVILLRDENILDSKKGNNQVCFSTEAVEEGEYNYRIRAVTSGSGSSAVKKIDVLEAGEEFDTFPSKVASVETEPGIAKITIYNTQNSTREYDVSLEDINDRWVSSTSKQAVLPKGDRKTIYFYLNPRESGDYRPTVVVDSQNTEVYREKILLESVEKQPDERKGLLRSLSLLVAN